MPVRGNIGNIGAAIEEGRRAFENVDYGPVIPASVNNIEKATGDWGIQIVNPNIFVMGVHKWGSPTLKVTS